MPSQIAEQSLRGAAGHPIGATLSLSLLGPVEVSSQGSAVTLSPLELNLLVILALTPGVAVSTDKLIDELWGAQLPSAPRSRIQGLVSGLRRKVGDAVLTRHPGYLVDPLRLERDLDESDRLVASSRQAADPGERLRLLVAAQALWRGEPLTGVSTPGVESERARLVEHGLLLLEARCEAELAMGNHRSLAGVLARAVSENPFREQLACLYITALYRSNRQADALAVYHELRERLADELGSDVCPELRELYAHILSGERLPGDVEEGEPGELPVGSAVPRGTAPDTARPAQLPARDGLFLGRAPELAELSEAAASSDGGVVAVVSGPGGLGKTALVIEWANRVAEEFPDGQVFLELGGEDTKAEEAVASALVALGVAEADVPSGLADRIGLYRTMVRDRRLLVVADNVSSVEQVLALALPSRTGQLVVTARPRLVSLAAHQAMREIILQPLPQAESSELLSRIVGAERLTFPEGSALVQWCGGWPLLIRHVGALLDFRPSQLVPAFVRELEAGAFDAVLHGDPRSVGAALAHSYASLSPAAAQLFERLALNGGACCLPLAAVAAGTSGSRVRRLLDELTGVHFLVETRSGEFRCHDVIARFGHRLACEQEWTALAGGGPDALAAACQACRLADHASVVPAQTVPGDGFSPRWCPSRWCPSRSRAGPAASAGRRARHRLATAAAAGCSRPTARSAPRSRSTTRNGCGRPSPCPRRTGTRRSSTSPGRDPSP